MACPTDVGARSSRAAGEASEPTTFYRNEDQRHNRAGSSSIAEAVLGSLMSFDLPATPVEIVKVGDPALGNGTRIVPQELFGAPALHELIEVSSFSRGRRLPRAG